MGADLRHRLRQGDFDWIVARHGALYAEEYGFDETFAAYVAGPLGDCVHKASPRERVWIAEQAGERVGCVAIVEATREIGQLRWYLVEPAARGRGVGTALLQAAVSFARRADYGSVILWTVNLLPAAARRYRAEGFMPVERKPGRQWGVDLIEERWELSLH